MKLAILGNGALTCKELEVCIQADVSEIFTNEEGSLNPGLINFCRLRSIKLVTPDKTKGCFYNVMSAVFLCDAILSFQKIDRRGARYFRYVSPDKEEYDIVISGVNIYVQKNDTENG